MTEECVDCRHPNCHQCSFAYQSCHRCKLTISCSDCIDEEVYEDDGQYNPDEDEESEPW